MRTKRWNDAILRKAVIQSTSIRQVLHILGLKEAGGNYVQVTNRINLLNLDISHFTGKGWSKGKTIATIKKDLRLILIEYSNVQSYKLKLRLFQERLKEPKCEICGWAEKSNDGRIPVELDHINGIRTDNRLANLRILCPNCHSLQTTHRGKISIGSVAELVYAQHLKCCDGNVLRVRVPPGPQEPLLEFSGCSSVGRVRVLGT